MSTSSLQYSYMIVMIVYKQFIIIILLRIKYYLFIIFDCFSRTPHLDDRSSSEFPDDHWNLDWPFS
jgi:hypothetical protein